MQLYAYQRVTQNSADEDVVALGLGSSNSVTKVGNYGLCDFGLGTFVGKNITYRDDKTVISFGSASNNIGEAKYTCKSEVEANAWFASDEGKKAYDILESVHY